MIQFLHSSKLVYSSSQHRLAQHFPPLSSLSHLNSQLFFFGVSNRAFVGCEVCSPSLSFPRRVFLMLALGSLSFPLVNVKMRMVIPQLEKTLMGWATRNFSFFSVPLKNFHSGISFTGCDDLCIFFYLHSSMWALLVLVHEFLTRRTHSTPIRPRSDHDSFICHNFELFPLIRELFHFFGTIEKWFSRFSNSHRHTIVGCLWTSQQDLTRKDI